MIDFGISTQLSAIGNDDNNELNKERILEDKIKALEDLKLELHKELQSMANSFEDNPNIKIVWDSAKEKFYATQR